MLLRLGATRSRSASRFPPLLFLSTVHQPVWYFFLCVFFRSCLGLKICFFHGYRSLGVRRKKRTRVLDVFCVVLQHLHLDDMDWLALLGHVGFRWRLVMIQQGRLLEGYMDINGTVLDGVMKLDFLLFHFPSLINVVVRSLGILSDEKCCIFRKGTMLDSPPPPPPGEGKVGRRFGTARTAGSSWVCYLGTCSCPGRQVA